MTIHAWHYGLSFSRFPQHQAEDKQLITELVVNRMNQLLSKAPIPSPQKPTATQQPQTGSAKESESNKVPSQRPPPQGCLQYILDCNGIAVGPKQVQAT
uniref:Uncharacterized protein n=1 Tax=Laticauda laticaudata TaxID=8630 RepID=A0A8C5RIH9_LATLA